MVRRLLTSNLSFVSNLSSKGIIFVGCALLNCTKLEQEKADDHFVFGTEIFDLALLEEPVERAPVVFGPELESLYGDRFAGSDSSSEDGAEGMRLYLLFPYCLVSINEPAVNSAADLLDEDSHENENDELDGFVEELLHHRHNPDADIYNRYLETVGQDTTTVPDLIEEPPKSVDEEEAPDPIEKDVESEIEDEGL